MKKISNNSIYIILNLVYIIPGIICAFGFFTSFYFSDILYSILSIINLSQTLDYIFAIIIWYSFSFFYFISNDYFYFFIYNMGERICINSIKVIMYGTTTHNRSVCAIRAKSKS